MECECDVRSAQVATESRAKLLSSFGLDPLWNRLRGWKCGQSKWLPGRSLTASNSERQRTNHRAWLAWSLLSALRMSCGASPRILACGQRPLTIRVRRSTCIRTKLGIGIALPNRGALRFRDGPQAPTGPRRAFPSRVPGLRDRPTNGGAHRPIPPGSSGRGAACRRMPARPPEASAPVCPAG